MLVVNSLTLLVLVTHPLFKTEPSFIAHLLAMICLRKKSHIWLFMCGDTEAPFDSSFDSSFNSFTLCPGFDTDYLGFPPPESNAPNVTYMNIQPTDKDVLFRCGEGVNRHPGKSGSERKLQSIKKFTGATLIKDKRQNTLLNS